ncbi:MAG: 5'-methylthioadenosine/S-adenosylhomocysteine nucleosidase [Termitinemataceae bacterium]|nr:MAG: 5'-methylthioadenosine/S-adenosylhomocysteine nucleosidase [Termitinemataceae bacterium]
MIGIIGAMKEEVEILQSLMQDIKIEDAGSFRFICGTICKKNIVLLQCGIGKVNAAVGCALLIERYGMDFIVNTGCAGGVNPQNEVALNFGDVVLSDSLVQHDFDLSAFGRPIGQVPDLPHPFIADKKLIGMAASAIDQLKKENVLPKNLSYVSGLIASGDAFMCEPLRIANVRKIFPSVRALEMEGASIAQTCTLFNVPFIIIRAMSDIAGEESPLKFEEYLPIAAKNSSAIVKKMLENL